jgi:RNA polymerase sigma factor (sigma-70 family)
MENDGFQGACSDGVRPTDGGDGFRGPRDLLSELVSRLEPKHFPPALLRSRWVRAAGAEVERAARDGGGTVDQLFPGFLARLTDSLLAIHNSIKWAAHRACSSVGAGACGGRDNLANEVAGDLHLAVMNGNNPFNPDCGCEEEGWFYGIARNLVKKAVYKAQRQDVRDVSVLNPTTPDTVAEEAESADTVRAMLAVLDDPDEQKTFRALYIEELTPEQAGERLGVSKWAIYKRKESIVKKLQAAGFTADGRRE